MKSGWMHTNGGEGDEKFSPKTLIENVLMAVDGETLVAALATALAAKLDASAYTAADVKNKLLTVDGAGSNVDADMLDGQHGAYYLPASSYTAADVLAKLLTVDTNSSGLNATTLQGNAPSAFALASGHGFKMYAAIGDLGLTLTDSLTLKQVVEAMPDRSILICNPPTTATSDITPSASRYGTLEIIRQQSSRCPIRFTPTTSSAVYFNAYYQGTTYAWKSITPT